METAAKLSKSLDQVSAPFNDEDRGILANVETSIREGQELKTWWEEKRDNLVQINRFPVARQIHSPDANYGFLMEANLKSGALPLAGVIQDQLFSWPKLPPNVPFDH